MKRKNSHVQSSGQVVLMVLLASVLILILGLSAAKLATVETNIDTDQELLKRAFNAAESGIEYYIKTGEKSFESDDHQGRSTLTTEPLGNKSILSFNKIVGQEDVEIFWLVDHLDNGDIGSDYYSTHNSTIDICSDEVANVNFKIDYFYKDISSGDYKVQRGNGVNPWLSTSGGASNYCIEDFNLAAGDSILLAVSPMGVDTMISVKGSNNFPLQGEKIISTGRVGKVNNQVTIDHPYKLLTPFLFEAVVSDGVVTNK